MDKCCLDKCHFDTWNLFKMVPGTYVLSFVKIGSVTAEILLTLSFLVVVVVVGGGGGVQSHFCAKPKLRIWTNVFRINIIWKNVNVTVCIF